MKLLARRRGIGAFLYFLIRGISSGEPVPIAIAVVLGLVIAGSLYFKFKS